MYIFLQKVSSSMHFIDVKIKRVLDSELFLFICVCVWLDKLSEIERNNSCIHLVLHLQVAKKNEILNQQVYRTGKAQYI